MLHGSQDQEYTVLLWLTSCSEPIIITLSDATQDIITSSAADPAIGQCESGSTGLHLMRLACKLAGGGDQMHTIQSTMQPIRESWRAASYCCHGQHAAAPWVLSQDDSSTMSVLTLTSCHLQAAALIPSMRARCSAAGHVEGSSPQALLAGDQDLVGGGDLGGHLLQKILVGLGVRSALPPAAHAKVGGLRYNL